MANNSQDIRQLMNLMESVSEPLLLEGWLDGLKNKLSGRMGRKAREEMAARFAKEWYKWLGQTRREGTMDDMVRFMVMRVGFNKDDVRSVLTQYEHETGKDVEADIPGGANPSPEDDVQEPAPSAPSDPEEDGRPIPADLNTKLSDYGEVGQIEQEPATKEENGDVVDDIRNFISRGKLDHSKIAKKLSSLKPGQRLVLGKKAYSLGESVGQIYEDSEDSEILDRDDISTLMDLSAARVNDAYLLDGPANDEKHRQSGQAALNYSLGSRSPYRQAGYSRANADTPAPENTGGRRGSGQYDPKELVDTLKAYNYPSTRIESLARKVGRSDSISDMSDQDMDELALIGYAFFRSRT